MNPTTSIFLCVVVMFLRTSMVAEAQSPHDGVSQNFTFTWSPIDGLSQCARDQKTVVSEANLNHAQCAARCFKTSNCSNYNYFHNTTRCELYDRVPVTFSHEMDRCIHYHVSQSPYSCCMSNVGT